LEVKFGGLCKKYLKIEETSIRNNGQIRSFGRGEFVHLSIFDAMFKAINLFLKKTNTLFKTFFPFFLSFFLSDFVAAV
jgi:hypothetical protein